MSTAVPETLYAAFRSVVQDNVNVDDFMSSWVAQSGYPLLSVNVTRDRKKVIISQRKFLRNNPDHQDKTLWNIPITYASNKENTNFSITKTTQFLSKQSQEIELEEAIDWIVFNVQQTGRHSWFHNI